MSETQTTPTQPGAQAAPPLVVNVQYIKDLSFEVPNAPRFTPHCAARPRSASTWMCRHAPCRTARTCTKWCCR